jgi:SAM-dependent methyltransferase
VQIIDKALLDAVACAAPEPSSTGFESSAAARLVREMHRVLKPGGAYLLLTHAAWAQRQALLALAPWEDATVDPLRIAPAPPGSGGPPKRFSFVSLRKSVSAATE